MAKGGVLSSILNNPITQIVSDVAATATGNPELIPLINAGESTAGGLSSGQGIGKSLGRGALSGAESLAGQEIAGGLGIGDGNSFVNDQLGIDISPGATGLPDIGGGIRGAFNDTLNSLGLNGSEAGQGGAAGDIGSGISNSTNDLASGTATPTVTNTTPLNFTTSTNALDLGTDAATTSASSALPPLTGTGSNLAPGFQLNPSVAGSSFNAGGTTPFSAAAPLSGVSSGGFNDVLSKLGGGLEKNPIGALSVAGIGANLLKGSSKTGAENNLSAISDQQQATGTELINNARNGQLPPGLDSSITNAMNDQISAVKSKFASMGMSGSSSEQAAIQQVQQAATQERTQQIQQILTQGLSALGSAGQTDQAIVNQQTQSDKSLYDAIAALSGINNIGRQTGV